MSFPPGPKRPALLQTLAWMRRAPAVLDRCARRFGKAFTIRFLGGRRYVFLADPEAVRTVFTGSPDVFVSGRANRTFKPFLGEHSLFVLDGEPHKRHRRLITPSFRGERMRAYGALMRDLTLESLARWPEGRPFPIVEPLHAITLDVIFRAVFGVSDPAVMQALARLIDRLTGTTPSFLMFLSALQVDLGAWSPWGRFRRRLAEVHAILDGAIARARAAEGGREDILATLVAPGGDRDPLDDAEIRSELITLLGAGHETTTASLAWAFQWILGTDGVRERAIAEVRDVVGRGPLEPEHVPKLRYLDAAVQESLRISPPIPMVIRWLAEPATIGGWDLPAGAVVCPCAHLAHQDPAVYPEPARFDPERFLGERRPGPFEFFPFGGGNRLCVGLAFAIYEMKVILATVLSRADLRLAAPITRAGRRKGIVFRPSHGTPVILDRLLR